MSDQKLIASAYKYIRIAERYSLTNHVIIFDLMQKTARDRSNNGMTGWWTSTDGTSNDVSTCKHKGTSNRECGTTKTTYFASLDPLTQQDERKLGNT